MPNIKLHGFSEEESYDWHWKIAAALSGAPYKDEVVVTFCNDHVVNLKAEIQPYLEIVAPRTSREKIDDIEMLLMPLNIDIEVLYLERFTPKKSGEAA